MVLRLDAAAEARAARLHRESIIVDTLSGGPSLFTERMTKQALEDRPARRHPGGGGGPRPACGRHVRHRARGHRHGLGRGPGAQFPPGI